MPETDSQATKWTSGAILSMADKDGNLNDAEYMLPKSKQKHDRRIRTALIVAGVSLGVVAVIAAIFAIVAYVNSVQKKTNVRAVFSDDQKKYSVTCGDKVFTHNVP